MENGKLAEALTKAQKDFTVVKKNQTAKIPTTKGGEYSYNYADLADVLAMCLPALNKHGIALTQPIRYKEGKTRVTTRIELNGEVQESDGIPINEGLLPREFGATLTYWRRYDLSSFLSISTEDDIDVQKARKADGKSAGTEKFDKRAAQDTRLQEQIKPYQVNAFQSACNTSNRTQPEIVAFLKNLKHASASELLKGEFDMAIKWALEPQKIIAVHNKITAVHSSCFKHGIYIGDGNCPTCELGVTDRDIATVK